MIRFHGVTKKYSRNSENTALHLVSFQLQPGEMAFLTGHSGAGKSTLLKLIIGMEAADNGQIIIDNQDISKLPMRKIHTLRRQVGMIFQTPLILPRHTVFENVAVPLIVSGQRSEEVQKRVNAALSKVQLLNKAKNLPGTLSVGEVQRMGIARALVNRPKILLADEPTGNLDPELALQIMRLFEAFNQVGVTVLIASHDISLISKFPYRVLTLKSGKLV